MARKTASDFFDSGTTEPTNKTLEIKQKKDKEEASENLKSENKNVDHITNKSADSPITSNDEKDQISLVSNTTNLAQYPSFTPEQQAYYVQYAQYMQQYQQYYAHNAAVPVPPVPDPVYDYYAGNIASSASATSTSFESSRASRQMTAYFDPTKFQTVLSPEMQAAQRAQKEQQQSRLTAKDIEAFKKRKIEKKKGKNRWLYE